MVSREPSKLNIGVLALQGAFREHRQMLERLGVGVTEVRLPADLQGLDGLILPGGESTTMVKLLGDYGLWEALREFHAAGKAMWGTCAGAILLASEIQGGSPALPPQPGLGALDVTIRRNAFGRQVDSFTARLEIDGLGEAFPAVFIRAPVITGVGEGVRILARYGGEAVLVQQGCVLASSFHPELSGDTRLHELFIEKAY